ncbi:uncharacterized protein [Montipora foliosa]|uniref:uncharacterized protein isoform X2 n=1 Tax=Montipora foliosa TaxID=591990 RepID=UPI0035F20A29
MMRTTGLLVVFTLLVILYQTSAVPVASSYRLENENIMDVMEAKEKSNEDAEEEEKEDESDKQEEKEDKEEDDKKGDEEPKDEEEKKEDEEETKDDEEVKEDEEKKEEKDEDEQEPDLKEDENDESSAEESEDLESDNGSGKAKEVSVDNTESDKEKQEKRSISDPKKPSKTSQEKRQYCAGGYADMGCGGCCGTNDWCAGGTMCSNCKGGFYPPVTCSGCNTGCCPGITFPCVFGASVNNPGCECCKEKTPPGKCKWPCMWPCCCTCTPPKFEFKPLKPEPVCHCPSPHSHHTACGNHCVKRTTNQGPVKRRLMNEGPSTFLPTPYSYGYAPIISPFYDSVPTVHFPRAF